MRTYNPPRGIFKIIHAFLVPILVFGNFIGPVSVAVAAPSQAPLFAAFTTCADVTEIPVAECEALVALYNSMDGVNWTNHTDWLQTDTPCSWYGVSCGSGTNVTGISLAANQLTGNIPTEIGTLTSLQNLFLSGNQLSGEFPTSITNLINLTGLTFDCELTSSDPNVISFIDGILGSGWDIACGSISGTITDESDNIIQGAQICAVEYDSDDNVYCVQSDANGGYLITGLPIGDYRIEARADGWALEFYNDTFDEASANRVSVTAGATTSNIDFMLEPGGSISGHVYQADGLTPIANMAVSLPSPRFGGGTCTDENGAYTLNYVAYGIAWRVRAASNRGNWCGGSTSYASEYWEEVTNRDSATTLTLSAGTPSYSGIDFTLELGGSISGTITDESDNLIQGAQICAIEYDSDNNVGCVPSDVNGGYLITGLSTGDYRLYAYADGWALEYYNNTFDWASANRVAVTAGATTSSVNFALEPGGSISGHVYQADGVTPLANMNVSLDGPGFGDGTCTDENGAYTLNNFAYGVAWRIRAAPDGNNWCGGSNSYVSEYWQEVTDWNSATTLTLSAGTPSYSGINFTLELGGSISGTITDESDNIIQGAQICAVEYDSDDNVYCVQSGATGDYLITRLPIGDYRIEARADGWALEFYNDTFDEASANRVSVTADATTSNIDFALEPGGSISGHVYQADGVTPIANLAVSLDGPGFGGGTCTDENGAYTLNYVAYGIAWRVRAAPNGGNWCGGSNSYASEYWEEVINRDSATTLTLSAGTPNYSGIDFTLAMGGSISGYVYQDDGVTPIAGAEVRVWPVEEGDDIRVTTNADGSFVVDGLPSGDYIAFAKAAGRGWEFYDGVYTWGTATAISVTQSNDTSGIDFTLGLGGTISGFVYEANGVTPIENMAIYLLLANNSDGPIIYTCSDASGHFSIGYVPYDVGWWVGAVPAVRCPGEPEGYVHEYWQDTYSWDDAAIILLSQSLPNYNSIVFTLDQGETTSSVVGTSGGTVETQDVVLDIPSGAISSDITFTITDGGNDYQVTTDEGGLDVILSTTIGPEGTIFANPATLIFHWSDANNDGIVDGTTFNENNLSLSKDGIVIAGPCLTDTTHCDTNTNTFTVQVSSLSEFVIGVPAVCYSLSLGHTGQGSSPTATPSSSTGCTAGKYVEGESISLSGATPSTGWLISGWTGTNNNSSTTSTNTVTMPASDHTANVNYSQIEYSLTIESAHGAVAKNPNQTIYHEGDVVQLTSTPNAGWSFANWTGGLTGSANPGSITIHGNTSVTANYTQNEYTLTITSINGTVTKSPNQATYHEGDVVQLTSTPNTGWSFANWIGGLTGTSNPDSVTIHDNTSVTANYTQIVYTLFLPLTLR